MMDYRKIAKIFHSGKWATVSVWRKAENEYWITNTYVMIRLDQETFQKFKSKYCSYAKNPYIPDLKVGEKSTVRNRRLMDSSPDMQMILDQEKGLQDIVMSQLLMDIGRSQAVIYSGDGFAGLVDIKYFELFGWDNNHFKTAGPNKPVYVYNLKDEPIGCLMPIRNVGKVEEEIRKLKVI